MQAARIGGHPCSPTGDRHERKINRRFALARHRAPLHPRRCGETTRHGAHRTLAGAPGGGEVLAAPAHAASRGRARLHERQPGRAGGASRPQSHLLLRMAGRGRCQYRRRDVSRPKPLPGRLGAAHGRAHQQCPVANGSDPAPGRQIQHRLAGADHRRRRGGLRRQPQRVRAHQGPDPRRCGSRALRGSTLLCQEVRSPGG